MLNSSVNNVWKVPSSFYEISPRAFAKTLEFFGMYNYYKLYLNKSSIKSEIVKNGVSAKIRPILRFSAIYFACKRLPPAESHRRSAPSIFHHSALKDFSISLQTASLPFPVSDEYAMVCVAGKVSSISRIFLTNWFFDTLSAFVATIKCGLR